MILWLLLYTQLALAQNDPVIEEYCFSSVGKMQAVLLKLKFILVPVDKTQEDKNCFTVSTAGHRRELVQSYVRRSDPSVQIGFSSAEIRRTACHIKVDKIKHKAHESVGAGISSGLATTVEAVQAGGESKDTLTIQTLKEFELTVNQDVIKGECRVINPTRYEILLEVRKDAIPLLPPLPAGTTVLIPDAQMPKPQETSRLQTTLQMNSGERIEIGSVVRNLRNDASALNLDSGLAAGKGSELLIEKVFLSIE